MGSKGDQRATLQVAGLILENGDLHLYTTDSSPLLVTRHQKSTLADGSSAAYTKQAGGYNPVPSMPVLSRLYPGPSQRGRGMEAALPSALAGSESQCWRTNASTAHLVHG